MKRLKRNILIVMIILFAGLEAMAQCPDFSVGRVMSKAEESLGEKIADKISSSTLKKLMGTFSFELLKPSSLSSDADKPGLGLLKQGTREYQAAFADLDHRSMKSAIKKMEKGLSQAKYNKNMPSNCYREWKEVIDLYKDFANQAYRHRSQLN